MSFYVYLIHNIIDNKVYVGKTRNLKQRWLAHLSLSRRNATNQYIHRAMHKHGPDNFTFSLIQELSSESEYNSAEKYWISYFDSMNQGRGYNLTGGGDGSSSRPQTIATRKKISDAKLNTMTGKDNPFYGKKHTNITKSEISLKNTGLRRSDKFKMAKSSQMIGNNNHFYGKYHSIESRRQMSMNGSCKKLTPEQVFEIIDMYKNKRYYQRQIASMFGISKSQVGRIVNGQRWKCLVQELT